MKALKKTCYSIPQLKQVTLCVSDLVMDMEVPSDTVRKIVKLLYKESVKLDRFDIIENLNLHCLIG